MNAFEIRSLTVAYDRKTVLEDASVEIPPGHLTAIVGPNGAGKSTMIKAALGLVPRLSGAFYAFGKPFTGHNERVGYVPQRESVDWDFPVTVRDVVLTGLTNTPDFVPRWSQTDEEAARADELIESLGLDDRRHARWGVL